MDWNVLCMTASSCNCKNSVHNLTDSINQSNPLRACPTPLTIQVLLRLYNPPSHSHHRLLDTPCRHPWLPHSLLALPMYHKPNNLPTCLCQRSILLVNNLACTLNHMLVPQRARGRGHILRIQSDQVLENPLDVRRVRAKPTIMETNVLHGLHVIGSDVADHVRDGGAKTRRDLVKKVRRCIGRDKHVASMRNKGLDDCVLLAER
ncbi:hypothetical protein BCR44DRAFT_276709 [Catenaria anguillulae PL171]|uniref:Uncharacterized protein n=1 Tax=Catenaria anguillulae PL171 TaxID=765915 RepID=A0A1Y2H6J9_9FUNG|nr:hypothetical protein BCR44DRAFT_276709 [Catenaria anguillulae PL171]